jgi:hypothetical protein
VAEQWNRIKPYDQNSIVEKDVCPVKEMDILFN